MPNPDPKQATPEALLNAINALRQDLDGLTRRVHALDGRGQPSVGGQIIREFLQGRTITPSVVTGTTEGNPKKPTKPR